MHVFIKCTCGQPIGNVFLAYQKIKTARVQAALKKHDISIGTLPVTSQVNIPMKDVLEDLGLVKYCCKQHLVNTVSFVECKLAGSTK